MNYVTNETGDIKVLSDKGDVKWFPKRIVENDRLMKESGFKIVEAPFKMEAKPKVADPKSDEKK